MNRSISRWITGMFSLTLAAALCAGCSESAEPSASVDPVIEKLTRRVAHQDEALQKVTLHFWTFHLSKEFEFMQRLAQRYTSLHPEVEIKVEYISSDDYFTGTRLLSAFAAGQGPDIFLVSPGNINKYVDANIAAPLTDLFTPEIRNDFYENALDAVTINNDIYAVPFEIELLALYYNKKMFEDKHLNPPKTWDDMLASARALHSGKVSGLTVETFGGVYQNFTFLPFLWQTGADVWNADGSRSGLDDPRALQMYTFFRQMRDEGLLNRQPSRPTTDIGILASGETAMQVSGSWNIRMIESNYASVPIGVVPLPIPEGGVKTTIAGGWKVAVNKQSEHADEAKRFVMWAFAEDTNIPLEWCNSVKFAYSPRKSVMEAGRDSYQKGLRSVFTSEIFGTERTEPRLPADISQIFGDSLQNLLYGAMSGEQAAREASDKMNVILASRFKK